MRSMVILPFEHIDVQIHGIRDTLNGTLALVVLVTISPSLILVSPMFNHLNTQYITRAIRVVVYPVRGFVAQTVVLSSQ